MKESDPRIELLTKMLEDLHLLNSMWSSLSNELKEERIKRGEDPDELRGVAVSERAKTLLGI